MAKLDEIQKKVYLEQLTSLVKPVFCPDCGSKMYPTGLTDPIDRYDNDGRRQFLVVLRCPKSRWYHFQSIHAARVKLVKEKR